MNSSSSSSLSSATQSKADNSNCDANKENDIITLTEKIKLKKDQYEF
jgi:hypothetical protein